MLLISTPLLTVLGIGVVWLLYWRLSRFPATENILAGLCLLAFWTVFFGAWMILAIYQPIKRERKRNKRIQELLEHYAKATKKARVVAVVGDMPANRSPSHTPVPSLASMASLAC